MGSGISHHPTLWQNDDQHSLEYSARHDDGEMHGLEGTVILLLDGTPARVAYQIECDRAWRTRPAAIRLWHADIEKHLHLSIDPNGVWRADGAAIPIADGLLDIDLEITPATNTIPIRRLDLAIGESREVTAVWVRFPGLTLERLDQRYTRLDTHRYRYEAPTLDFTAVLEADDDGVIVRYGDLWRRVER